ncbi:MAG: hypothetical protein H6696_05445 [Deferribacteres bacterium]|nr:hypothetical protein [candidate division KSB1 bacterium]MCB9501362.1 hypothetical protein [Deferribacteres bacterium]
MNTRNEFLFRLGRIAKKDRKEFWGKHNYSIRRSKRRGHLEAGLWFRTRGCRHDHKGGCIMCDYSSGPYTAPDNMISYVREGLETFNEPYNHLLVSPSGSMLDEWEVPIIAREGIFKLLKDSKHETFSFETRVDTITQEKMNQSKDLLENRLLKVYIGLESANPWISKYCINKDLPLYSFQQATRILKQFGTKTAVNILLGTPFLSPLEDIQNVVQSLQWALEQGADECYLFPTHVKEATLLFYLYQKGFYSPPSLWSLVEVLKRIGSQIAQDHTRLSWYTSYGAFNVVASPTTCKNCHEKIISLLDRFAKYGEFDAVQELIGIECKCKDVWRNQIIQTPSSSLADRVINGYDFLAKELLLNDWWKNNRQTILDELYSDLP